MFRDHRRGRLGTWPASRSTTPTSRTTPASYSSPPRVTGARRATSRRWRRAISADRDLVGRASRKPSAGARAPPVRRRRARERDTSHLRPDPTSHAEEEQPCRRQHRTRPPVSLPAVRTTACASSTPSTTPSPTRRRRPTQPHDRSNNTMHATALVQADRPDLLTADAVVTARDVVRRYGAGDTAVDALRGVVGRHRPRSPDRRDGPVGLRQVDADAHPRRARQADRGGRSPSPASTSAASTTRS